MSGGVVIARSEASKFCEGGVVVPILGPNSELPLKMYRSAGVSIFGQNGLNN
jgi:hypothetical protein